MEIKGNEYIKMSIPEQLDCFFADTFISHTKSHKCMMYKEIAECYEQWCDATGCAPLATQYQLGKALRNRFFHKNIGNYKHWFLEIRPDLLEEVD